MAEKYKGKEPAHVLEVMAFVAAIQAGEVKFRKEMCLVPSCNESVSYDYDGGQYIYCERHNEIMHLDHSVDVSSIPGVGK
jgi:hypothetical protein